MRELWLSLVLGALALPLESLPASQTNLVIQHPGMGCIPDEDFAVVEAGVSAATTLRSVKLYFRSLLYTDFYYVEMTEYDGMYVGILPQPSEETREIAYYIEALDDAFESTRSREYVAPVRDPCSQRRTAASYLGDDGGIVVGATTAGSSPLPPGFRALGIMGTITAAGAVSTLGGGLGAGTLVVASAAVAGTAGAVVAATGEGPAATSSAASTSTTSIAVGVTTTSAPSGTTTVPSSSSSSPSSSTTSVAATTTPSSTTSAGSTTSSAPSSSSSTTSSSTTSSSSSSSSTTSAPPAPVACFTVQNLSLCRLRLDASCSTGPIDTYEWTLDTGGALDGPVSASGEIVLHDYGLYPFCLTRQVTNALRVQGPGGSDTTSKTFRFSFQRTDASGLGARLDTLLASEESSIRGTLSVNGSVSRTVTGSVPVTLSFRGRPGANVLEAHLDTPFAGAGTWVFELDATPYFVSGSLTVEQGQLLASGPTRLVFRVDGAHPAPIRFRFELAPDRP